MIFGRIKAYLAAFAAGAIGLVLFVLKIKSNTKKEIKGNEAIEDQKAQERGRKAVQAGRASGATPDERVRGNNDDWGRL